MPELFNTMPLHSQLHVLQLTILLDTWFCRTARPRATDPGDNNTVIILAVVFSILGFFLILLIVYCVIRKKNQVNSVSVSALTLEGYLRARAPSHP